MFARTLLLVLLTSAVPLKVTLTIKVDLICHYTLRHSDVFASIFSFLETVI